MKMIEGLLMLNRICTVITYQYRIHSSFEESTLKFDYFSADKRMVNSASDKFLASGNFLKLGMIANSTLLKAVAVTTVIRYSTNIS